MEKLYLPHPDGAVGVEITLALVEQLEEGGSLLELAERLVAKELKLAEAVTLLKSVYAHAGITAPPDDFIVAQQPHLHLARLLTAIIAPLSALGAIDQPKKSLSLRSLRRFYLGVLRWEPQALRAARLTDLEDAWKGYALHHGIETEPVTRAFMDEMLKKFGG
ncbi:MAG: hypothetical protein ACAH80_04730 [Alphaproteobacteria bacterium]